MTKVRNLNGTSDIKVPDGYRSWKEWWEAKKGKKFGICSCEGCGNHAEVGTHVQKAGSRDNKWYIVPLCTPCNVGKKNIEFYFRDDDLEPVNP